MHLFLAGLLALLLLLLVAQLRHLSSQSTPANCKNECLQFILQGPPKPDNKYVKRFIQENYLTPPGQGPLQLSGRRDLNDSSFIELRNYLNLYFKDKRNGRFLVLGAGDGEYADVTLELERRQGWTGMLIEPLPQLNKLLRQKNRNVEIMSACVSPFENAVSMRLAYPSVNASFSDEDRFFRYRQATFDVFIEDVQKKNQTYDKLIVPCLPLSYILHASRTLSAVVDLLVLDMSGFDIKILASMEPESLPQFKMVLLVMRYRVVSSDFRMFLSEQNLKLEKTFETGNSVDWVLFSSTE